MGIDRDSDGVLDGDVPTPKLEITRAETEVLVTWPTYATGFVLERTTFLSDTDWQPSANGLNTGTGRYELRSSLSASSLFFRLRSLSY